VFKFPVIQPMVVMLHLEKMNKIKRCYFLAAICIAIFLSSCQKEVLSNSSTINTTSDNSSDAEALLRRETVVRYGAAISAPKSVNVGSPEDLNFQTTIASQLGVTCLREGILVPNINNKTVPELNTRYKILLNFNSPGKGILAVPFRTDIAQYKRDLNDELNTFSVMPAVAVIENEESNMTYFSGTAQEYVNQLQAAINVMHARNIKVANGGITSPGLNLLVYKDLRKQGKFDSAEQFRKLAWVNPDSPNVQNRAAFIDILLKNYRTMNMDYVNFHWKDSFPSTQALNQSINYLKKRTGKRIISTEIGQLLPDTNVLITHVQLCTDQRLPYIIWYSPDINSGLRGTPLQYPDITLTSNGYAYKNFIARQRQTR
jgi:hypothetical protein